MRRWKQRLINATVTRPGLPGREEPGLPGREEEEEEEEENGGRAVLSTSRRPTGTGPVEAKKKKKKRKKRREEDAKPQAAGPGTQASLDGHGAGATPYQFLSVLRVIRGNSCNSW